MMRLFVAVFVDNEFKAELAKVQDYIKAKTNPEAVKWVNLDQMHLTLKFLGDIQEDEVDRIKELLFKIEEPSFSFKVTRLGTFPNKGRIRVIWAGISEGDQPLRNLSSKVRQKLARWGEEEKGFSAHITLGRVRSGYDLSAGTFHLEEVDLKELSTKTQKVERFSLVESRLTKNGPIYNILQNYDLLKNNS